MNATRLAGSSNNFLGETALYVSQIQNPGTSRNTQQQSFAMVEKVALVGSGNWGSAIATKIGVNVLANDMFDKGARRPY